MNYYPWYGILDSVCMCMRLSLYACVFSGVENNMCCGTHVANTSHLQAIKLLGTEKGKKGKTNLSFVAAGRLLKYLHGCLENEKALTGHFLFYSFSPCK